MKIAHPFLEETISIKPECPATLIIENPVTLREFIQDILKISYDRDSNIVLSINDKIVDFKKIGRIIIDPFTLNFKERTIWTRILNDLKDIALSESHYQVTNELKTKIYEWAHSVAEESDYPITPNIQIDLPSLLKVADYSADQVEDSDLLYSLCDYLLFLRRTIGIKFFIALHLGSYLKASELELFKKELIREEIYFLFLESVDILPRTANTYIIDSDNCFITM